MFRQSPRRYQRNGGMKMKHILQMSLLLGVSIWLFLQVQRSGSKKASSQENLKISENETNIKFGRKDLKPKAQVYGEDEKPIQVHVQSQERTPFDDETKSEDKEPERDSTEANPQPENFADSVKEAETEEGSVAKEGHVEENENKKNGKEVSEDQLSEDKDGEKEHKAVEEENDERDAKKQEGEDIENEGANAKVKKNTEKSEDMAGESTQENTSEEANGNKGSKNNAGIGKVGKDIVQKAAEGVAFIEKKIAKEVSGAENEDKGNVNDDSQQQLPEDGENEGIGKVSDYASKTSIEGEGAVDKKAAQEGSDGKNGDGGKESEYSGQKLTEDEGKDTFLKSTEDGIVEKKVLNETSNGEDKGKSKGKNSKEMNDSEEKGNKPSNVTAGVKEQAEKLVVSLTEKSSSFPEGKIYKKQKNDTERETFDGVNLKYENGTEAEKGNKKTGSMKQNQTKKPLKMYQNELLLGGEYESVQNYNSFRQPNVSNEQPNDTNPAEKTNPNLKKSNSSLVTKAKQTVAEIAKSAGLNIELNATRAIADGISTANEINSSSGNNTKPEEKTASYDDSNGNDDGQSNMDNFSNLTNSSGNETADRSTDNERDSSSASSLPQEEKEGRTDLDTLPESGNESNNRDDAMLSDI